MTKENKPWLKVKVVNRVKILKECDTKNSPINLNCRLDVVLHNIHIQVFYL